MDGHYLTMDDRGGLPSLLTVPELADYLGVGRNRAYSLLREGVIKGFRIGSVWKVSEEAIRQCIREKSGMV